MKSSAAETIKDKILIRMTAPERCSVSIPQYLRQRIVEAIAHGFAHP